nr:hypothetical protein [Streptomyces sp. CRN 30]
MGEHEVFLAGEVPVEGGPGDLGLGDDAVDADMVDAVGVNN